MPQYALASQEWDWKTMQHQGSSLLCGSETTEWKVKKWPLGERYFQSLKAYAVDTCLLWTQSAQINIQPSTASVERSGIFQQERVNLLKWVSQCSSNAVLLSEVLFLRSCGCFPHCWELSDWVPLLHFFSARPCLLSKWEDVVVISAASDRNRLQFKGRILLLN